LNIEKTQILRKRILYALLYWGLGHATRSIPIIRALRINNELVLASTGRSLRLLQAEFPGLETIDFPDYGIRYSREGHWLLFFLIIQLPRIIFRLILEKLRTERIVRAKKIDLIFSDNRYGVYSQKVPCYIMTHQLRYHLSRNLRGFEWISVWFNRLMFKHFDRVFVPDVSGDRNLTGILAHSNDWRENKKIHYVGILSSIDREIDDEDIDLLIMISGPEPQRTIFEGIIGQQIGTIPGRKIVVLGKPGEESDWPETVDLRVFSHLDRKTMQQMINRSRMIIARSGYSTIMELAALGKRAFFIPTPGQTEQEYLAEHMKKMGWWYTITQDQLNIARDLQLAWQSKPPKEFTGDFNNLTQMLAIIRKDLD
jgi:uncharacterized protein (TIGR00661 family)